MLKPAVSKDDDRKHPRRPGGTPVLENRGVLLFLFLVLLTTLFLRYAEPTRDTDLFWQMNYGKYMVQNRTLHPDHTAYTWTPVDRGWVYVAWIGEALLYSLYAVGGLGVLFAFKYACVLLVLLCLGLYSMKIRGIPPALNLFMLMITMVGIYSGVCLKPEIFSLIFITLLAVVYYHGKTFNKPRLFYLFCPIMLLWVNTHGGFIFGVLFILSILAGETMNRLFSQRCELTGSSYRTLLLSSGLCLCLIMVNPYGLNYPGALLLQLSEALKSPDGMVGNAAYLPAFGSGTWYPYYLFVMGLITVWLLSRVFLKNREFDFGVILPNAIFALLYTMYVRATYLWPPVWYAACVYLIRGIGKEGRPERKDSPTEWISAAAFLLLACLTVWKSVYYPMGPGTWCGFGHGYMCPVEEADYVERRLPGRKIVNDYGAGGYLGWRFYPDGKVFIDPRYGPFVKTGVYEDYRKFEAGRSLEGFEERYGFDVAIIRFRHRNAIRNLLRSPRWRLVFYGKAAAVFIRNGAVPVPVETWKTMPVSRFDDLKNFLQARSVLLFSLGIRDFKASRRILSLMEERFFYGGFKAQIVDLSALCDRMEKSPLSPLL